MFTIKNKKGFTLIELLIVIAIITILAAAVVVTINPAKHFKAARNATRWNQMNTIATAVYSYAIEHGGAYPEDLTCIGEEGVPVVIEVVLDADGNPTVGTWCWQIVVPEYLRIPPLDPLQGESYQIEFLGAPGTRKAIQITSTAPEANEAGNEVVLIQ